VIAKRMRGHHISGMTIPELFFVFPEVDLSGAEDFAFISPKIQIPIYGLLLESMQLGIKKQEIIRISRNSPMFVDKIKGCGFI
jgi:hypothetical protein